MRPAGEIRQALREVAPPPLPDASGASYLDMAQALAGRGLWNVAAPSELRLVRTTVKNMVQAGELRRVGSVRRPGVRKALGLYAAADEGWDAQAATRPGGRSMGTDLVAAWCGVAA